MVWYGMVGSIMMKQATRFFFRWWKEGTVPASLSLVTSMTEEKNKAEMPTTRGSHENASHTLSHFVRTASRSFLVNGRLVHYIPPVLLLLSLLQALSHSLAFATTLASHPFQTKTSLIEQWKKHPLPCCPRWTWPTPRTF